MINLNVTVIFMNKCHTRILNIFPVEGGGGGGLNSGKDGVRGIFSVILLTVIILSVYCV